MALVVYSDESDISDTEDSEKQILSNEKSLSKNDINLSIPLATDVVDDVPTPKTWQVSKKTPEISSTMKNQKKNSLKEKGKIKFILSSLSELKDDEDDYAEEEPVKKKVKPSSNGTGLFAHLPKPKVFNTLVPLTVSRKPKNIVKKVVEKIPEKTNVCDDNSDDEFDTESKDFFSLTTSEDDIPKIQNNITVADTPLNPVQPDVSHPSSVQDSVNYPSQSEYYAHSNEDYSAHQEQDNSDGNQEALMRLTGRRKAEIEDVIEVKADDFLMKRDEWVRHALTEEKPQMGFSKNREGMPSVSQKRKHQIHYLAHQAKEREQELLNSWGQNRFTKKQTQSKYGF